MSALSVSVAQTSLFRGVKWSVTWRFHFDYFSSSASTTFIRKWLLATASSWWHFLAFSQGCILIWNVLVLPSIHSRLRQCGATRLILMLFPLGAISLLGWVPLTTSTTRCGMKEWRLLKEWKMWLRRVSWAHWCTFQLIVVASQGKNGGFTSCVNLRPEVII